MQEMVQRIIVPKYNVKTRKTQIIQTTQLI